MRITMQQKNIWGNSHGREMEVVYQSNAMVITQYIIENAKTPLYVDDLCVLENGYTAVSFIEYGKWYIVDKVFNFEEALTGFLIKLVTPVEENFTFLATTDLFMKIWVSPDSTFRVFGSKMFKRVAEDGLLSESVEKSVKETIDTLILDIREGRFPSEFMRDFKVEKEM